ncbi:type III polyketide synthase, partial [Pseudomonas sp. BGM005]|nr:type III polyketide synthase [Pseudomonas sp. BG5]
MSRSVVLRSLRTIVPDTVLAQPEIRDIFAAQPDVGRLGQRIIGASFN